MKKLFLNSILFFILTSLAFSKEKIFSTEFTDRKQLPSETIVCNEYFEDTGNIFLILEDSVKSYSKVWEYETGKKEFLSVIFEAPEDCHIQNFSSNDKGFSFSLCKKDLDMEKESYEIFYYNCENRKLKNITPDSINDSESFFPTYLCLYKNFVCYLEQNMIEKKSTIHKYDIIDEKDFIIASEDFSKEFLGISFFNIDFDTLVYDVLNSKNRFFVFYNLDKDKTEKTVKDMSNPILYHGGVLSLSKNALFLYALTETYGDLIYRLDLKNGRIKKLVGFREKSVIKNDKMYFDGTNVYYIVQMNVSGRKTDRYYIEHYDVQKRRSGDEMFVFSYFMNDRYSCKLLYENREVSDIRLEIFKN